MYVEDPINIVSCLYQNYNTISTCSFRVEIKGEKETTKKDMFFLSCPILAK